MKKGIVISIVVAACIVTALVVYAQMSGWHNYIDYPVPEEIAAAEVRTEAEGVKETGDTDFVYREPDTRYFTRENYKEDIFPAECRYELITLEDGKAIMLYVLLDESKIRSIKDKPYKFGVFDTGGVPGGPAPEMWEQYDYLKKQGSKPSVYRFALLDKDTGEEMDIAYFLNPVKNKPVGNCVRFEKPVIYDAAVKDDLSVLRFIVDFDFRTKLYEFRLKDIAEKPEGTMNPRSSCHSCNVARRNGSGRMSARFLTPGIVSVSYEFIEHKKGKDLDPVPIQYHFMPVIRNENAPFYQRLLWCSDGCNINTFNYILHEMDIENAKECNFYDPFTKTGGPHKWTGVPEPEEYDMSEWEGWTRMNHSSAWLKK